MQPIATLISSHCLSSHIVTLICPLTSMFPFSVPQGSPFFSSPFSYTPSRPYPSLWKGIWPISECHQMHQILLPLIIDKPYRHTNQHAYVSVCTSVFTLTQKHVRRKTGNQTWVLECRIRKKISLSDYTKQKMILWLKNIIWVDLSQQKHSILYLFQNVNIYNNDAVFPFKGKNNKKSCSDLWQHSTTTINTWQDL